MNILYEECPQISLHASELSAHYKTPLWYSHCCHIFLWWLGPCQLFHIYIYIYKHTYIHTCLLLISILWYRQAIFESKGDKLSSSAECRVRTQGLRHLFASSRNACWQTDWAVEDQAKNLNSTVRPYDQRAFSPLDLTVSWLSHLALAIYMCVVVNFDALAQANDIQIERRQVVFLCWLQDLNPGSQTPNRQQTECSLTKRLSYRESSKNLNSTAGLYDQRAFSPLDPTVSWLSHLALAIYITG